MDDETKRPTAQVPDRYEVVREHGRGGMATVYLATDRKHDREVALKVMAPELAIGIGAERFVREIQIAAHLNHPHIVPLLDSGLADGLPYYVMPFVEGESLRERLSRDGSLPAGEALRIANDVAEALEYAHDHDVIHRDIKPGNILLTGRGAVVTDFGIAAAVDRLPEDHLTRTGLSVGTAGYMSPEQASGERDIDGRTDQYSLACVLYEMLAGRPPYTGRNARAILSRQLTEPAPPVSSHAEAIPEDLEALLDRALAREAEDRFTSTHEFATELEEIAHRAATGESLRFRTRPAIWAALAAAVLLAVGSWFLPDRGTTSTAEVQADTPRYAVFPFEGGDDAGLQEVMRLRGELQNWRGIDLVPQFQLQGPMERIGTPTLSIEQAAVVALGQDASRFFMGSVRPWSGDSIAVEVGLYQAAAGGAEELATAILRLPVNLTGTDSLFEGLVIDLLWHGDPPATSRAEVGTDVFPAAWAFSFGEERLAEWDLVRADSGFTRATEYDSEYAEAHLWRALVLNWLDADVSAWRISASQAARRSSQLIASDSLMAEALWLEAEGNLGEACPKWEAVTARYADNFASWYGLAECLRSDNAVVPDSTSASGWAFRSSRHGMLEAFEQAFLLLPAVLESFAADSYADLRELLLISGRTAQAGRALPPDSTRFRAFPAWIADTLAYLPRPVSDRVQPPSDLEARQRAQAVRQQRSKFRQVAEEWAMNAPRSAAAREALAIGLAISSDALAIDTLQRARALAEEPAEAFRMAALEVWLRVAFGLPSDESQLNRAVALADSLLADDRGPASGEGASALAALTGRGLRAAALARASDPPSYGPIPTSLAGDLAAYLVFAAIGGPADSLDVLERKITGRLEATLSPKDLSNAYLQLAQPVSLAFTSHAVREMERFESDWVVGAQLALKRGDSAAVREALLKSTHDTIEPYSVTFDFLLAGAGLWMAIGEPETAARWLDPTLSDLPAVSSPLRNPQQVAALVRLAGLRAEIALTMNDSLAARRWSRAVTILWSLADPYLEERVRSLETMAD